MIRLLRLTIFVKKSEQNINQMVPQIDVNYSIGHMFQCSYKLN